MAQTKKPTTASQAEIILRPQLKSCLVNLPSALVAVLSNANTVAQNVVVELALQPPSLDQKDSQNAPRSVYVGWTGMQSQNRLAPIVDRAGIQGVRGGRKSEHNLPTVELDTTMGRMLGIADGMKVAVTLHIDPPQAHTVHVEPLTATDWDIIELHARFLEMNFLSQVRALPNPISANGARSPHPLTLHLTPTSTANVTVAKLEPSADSSQAFVKISPDAEVIVAPKSHRSSSTLGGRDSRSVASTSRKSVGARSSASTARHRSTRDDESIRSPVFLRALDRSVVEEWFDEDDEGCADIGLRIWVERDLLLSKSLKGVSWVAVSIVRPTGLEEPLDPQTMTPEKERPATKVVARLLPWQDAPDTRHATMSSVLCATLASVGIIGGIVRLEAAPMQSPKTTSIMKQPQADSQKDSQKDVVVKALQITPFATTTVESASSITFGGETKAEKDRALERFKALFGGHNDEKGLLQGCLTHNMILPAHGNATSGSWPGGILRFDPAPASAPPESSRKLVSWLVGKDRKLNIEMSAAIAKPAELSRAPPGQNVPSHPPILVGIDPVIKQLQTALLHSSSVLLAGGLGSGKTSLTHHIIHTLRTEYLYHTLYYPCRTLITDETRVSTIRETMQRLFGAASWGARLGGKSVVILDDLDKLCPVETELQVGGENGRNKQISELVCSIVRQYCSRDSNVVLLATAQSKESVHNVIIGGHVVHDTVALKAPTKEGRRRILEHLARQKVEHLQTKSLKYVTTKHEANGDNHPWMDGSDSERPESRDSEPTFAVDDSIDFLDIAGQTDGYMAGDLNALTSRARGEALIRTVTENEDDISTSVSLTAADFTAALKGFTPASLRNVNLQSSTTSFSSIGGLHATRKTLLETLQYPTTYAPIFAQCPLRLRSGLLLYGFPGCGKTMLASAVAGECGLNFISVKGPEILNKYIGASEKSVRDLFDRAQAARPCVLFFDEFDSIAPKRGHDSTGVTDRVVNQLLTQMDGAEGLSGVYVLAATSRPDLIDPALLRPGRLDKSLLCDMPAQDDRTDILKAVSTKLKLERNLMDEEGPETLTEVARRTEGYSGADLQAIMYNAHLEAIHDILGPSNGTEDLGKSKSDASGTSSVETNDFTFFRLGDKNTLEQPTTNGTASHPTHAHLAERAHIAAKLSQMDQARKRARQQRHQQQQQQSQPAALANGRPHSHGHDSDSHEAEAEPIIAWRHIEKSLAETRPSLGKSELRRLRRVYGEFVTGRSGELPDGQAGTEIGGRTSLM